MALGNSILVNPKKKESIVSDLNQLLDTQVSGMGGVSGLMMKAGYATIKSFSPGYCTRAIEGLLPESFNALDPIWDEGIQMGDPVENMIKNKDPVADALLGITDGKIERSKNNTLKAVYGKCRDSVKKHIEEAVPGFAKIIDNHVKN